MSWPDRACASAAAVRISLLPCDVMKSICRSTFSFSAQTLAMASMPLLAPGTQWSQNPTDSLPAAYAPRTNGAATRADERAAFLETKQRLQIVHLLMIFTPVNDSS